MTFLPRGLVVIDVGDDEAAGSRRDKSHTSHPARRIAKIALDGMRMSVGQRTSGAWITAPNAIGSAPSFVVSKTISLGKRFRDLKNVFRWRSRVAGLRIILCLVRSCPPRVMSLTWSPSRL